MLRWLNGWTASCPPPECAPVLKCRVLWWGHTVASGLHPPWHGIRMGPGSRGSDWFQRAKVETEMHVYSSAKVKLHTWPPCALGWCFRLLRGVEGINIHWKTFNWSWVIKVSQKKKNAKTTNTPPCRRKMMLSTSVDLRPAAEDVTKLSVKETYLGGEREPKTSVPHKPPPGVLLERKFSAWAQNRMLSVNKHLLHSAAEHQAWTL